MLFLPSVLVTNISCSIKNHFLLCHSDTTSKFLLSTLSQKITSCNVNSNYKPYSSRHSMVFLRTIAADVEYSFLKN